MLSVTQNAQASSNQQTRSYTFDDLNRMTSGGEPGNFRRSITSSDSDPGTKGAANCSEHLQRRSLAKKWTRRETSFATRTDALHSHWMTRNTYPAGTYSSVTPSRFFVYDGASVDGSTLGNPKTRLAEAYTCFSPCSQKITDIGLSYTVRGETNDVYESTPHSGGYYQVPVSYWANKALNVLNSASCSGSPCLPGLTTFTYGADGEGRTNTVSAASGQNPVTATNYNLYNSPPQTTVTFGSGDSDVFNSDPNTGRMTQYKYNVGSNAVTGALTWRLQMARLANWRLRIP